MGYKAAPPCTASAPVPYIQPRYTRDQSDKSQLSLASKYGLGYTK